MKKLLGLAAAALLAGLIIDSRFSVQINEYSIEFDSLPESFDGCTVMLISDMHGKSFGRDNEKLIKLVRRAAPDIIAITGDMASSEEQLPALEALLRGIEGTGDIYCVNGNHEWAGGIEDESAEMMRKYGAHFLSNEYEILERGEGSIIVCGAEDRNGMADMIKPPALTAKLREYYPEEFILFLYHRNDILINYPHLPVDLVLSGHAHGGIVRLPFVGGLLDVRGKLGAEYESGLYEQGGLKLLVSRGLGNSVFIPRFLNRPDIPLITLRCAGRG